MSTRHADPSAPLSQNRYMSAPEYADTRINGIAVTAKAQLLPSQVKRSLLFFLQALSLKPGGLKQFCADFLAMFTGRIGTYTMHKTTRRSGLLDLETTRLISEELDPSIRQRARIARDARRARHLAELQQGRSDIPILSLDDSGDHPQLEPRTYESFLDQCREQSSTFENWIIELCVNPAVDLPAPDQPRAAVPWFDDLFGALYEYKRRYEENIRNNFVMTEVGRKCFDVLDVCLATGKMVVLEGNSRIGKTTAAEAWCDSHLGESRFVSLSGVSHKTGAFRAIAKVLGVASSYTRTATDMQARIEDTLQRSRLVLIIDEAHFLFSAAERVYSRPELVDWVNTALCNHHVPCALVCTPQFALRMARAEKQTTWNADQLRGRVKRFCTLPAAPRTEDLDAVARKLLPSASKQTIDYIVGYALSTKLHMPAVVDSIDEATLLAMRDGRERVTFEDVKRAITEYCAQSAQAMARAFSLELAPKRQRRRAPLERPAPARQSLTGLAPARGGSAILPQPSR